MYPRSCTYSYLLLGGGGYGLKCGCLLVLWRLSVFLLVLVIAHALVLIQRLVTCWFVTRWFVVCWFVMCWFVTLWFVTRWLVALWLGNISDDVVVFGNVDIVVLDKTGGLQRLTDQWTRFTDYGTPAAAVTRQCNAHTST